MAEKLLTWGAEPYLIAHKVRGEPAFDIAIKLQFGEEEGWLIPTSGHRAYPYWWLPLTHIPFELPDLPPDLPDHYRTEAAPKGQGRVTDLLGALGLRQQVKRRV